MLHVTRSDADKKAQGLYAQYRRKTILCVVVPVVLITSLVCSFYGLLSFLYLRAAEEVRDAPVSQSIGIVTAKSRFQTKMGMTTNFAIQIGDHKTSFTAADNAQAPRINIGDIVAVTYKVGKSGTYYVVDWQAPPRKVELPR